MNIQSIVLLALVVAAFASVLYHFIRKQSGGGGGCGCGSCNCGCDHCANKR